MLKIILASSFVIATKDSWLLTMLCLIILTTLTASQLSFDLSILNFTLVDNLSIFLMTLSVWLSSLMILGSFYIKKNKNNSGLFVAVILIMNALLLMSFSTSNMLTFYIMFEATLVPIFMLVLGWGYQPERVTASYYLLFYTLAASLPLLLSILYIDFNTCSLEFLILSASGMTSNPVLFVGVVLAFMVKMPVYFGHLWLPKAHVEAPMAGSMILAGVLLKLGGYGILRSIPVIFSDSVKYSNWLITLGLFGAISASFICIRQTDLKSLIAYSSVAHMGLVIVGLFLNKWTAWFGCVIIMIAHGLCSSALFCLVGMLYYRMGTRSMILIRSGITVMPLLSMWWFLFGAANMAAPPTPNLAGEIMIFMSSMSSSLLTALIVGVASFLAGAYNLYLFSTTQHGNKQLEMNSMSEPSTREHVTLTLHILPLLLSLFMMNVY
uniref:NADH-ubiquinone oxidoreductase chain 4 n=1 Tax=Diaphanosoma dubium TaxID=743458 RepID=A0A343VVL7_9CRUS|nr:NADH dehydrogenase subunit 4 [Diaphanosoma dubium]AVP74682.1 NADH dehydrogenase subunit 4 [Diaphanosoma dubium]